MKNIDLMIRFKIEFRLVMKKVENFGQLLRLFILIYPNLAFHNNNGVALVDLKENDNLFASMFANNCYIDDTGCVSTIIPNVETEI